MAKKKGNKNKAGSNFEDNISGEKIVDVEVVEVDKEKTSEAEKESESKKASGKSLIFYFLAFLLVVSVFGFLGYKFLLSANKDLQVVEDAVDESELVVLQQPQPTKIQQSDMQYGALQSNQIEDEKTLAAVENLVEDLPKQQPSLDTLGVQIYGNNNDDLQKLRGQMFQQNKQILLFLSAQNLQKIVSSGVEKIDEKALRNELKFFEEISAGRAGYAGKIQLLEYSLDGGMPSIAKLDEGLDELAKKLNSTEEKTFWQNFQDSIFGLVKVTKLDAEVEGQEGDYAKILLAKTALKNHDFNAAIELVEKISSAKTTKWKDGAYKLQRINETVEYLLDATRQNLLENYKNTQ
jgi:flagellar basal body-associated protein FliL